MATKHQQEQDNVEVERFSPIKEFPLITHGLPYPAACAQHLTNALDRSRPFLVISNSLAKKTDAVEQLKTALNSDHVAIAGIHIGMKPHTYYSEVLQLAGEVKDSGADSVITVGGGSLVDGAKAIVFAIANKAATHEELDLLFRTSKANRHSRPVPEGGPATVHPSSMPILCVTTTLSAGEFNPNGGATNDRTRHKQLFCDPLQTGPRVIVVDPELTTTTPERVWLSTGLRAVDHCVETICSSNPDEEGTEHSLRGIKLLIPGLLRTRRNPGDLEARLSCQLGSAESMRASVVYGVQVGGSHGIGHQLGLMGVPHAETTCICLPAVQKFNARVNAERQAIVLKALWTDPDIAGTLTRHSLVEGQADLGDALDAVIRELGFQGTLKDYGIGRDRLAAIARSSLEDPCCQWNAIPLEREDQVLDILEMCLGDQ